MKLLWPRPGQMPSLALLVAVALAVVGLTLAFPAMAFLSLFGGQLYYAGGDVTIDVLHSDSAYDEVLQLRSGSSILDVAFGSQVGSSVTLTSQQLADLGIGVGDELQFGIHVVNTDQSFVLGPGSRNVDGLDHAYVRTGRGSVYVGWEDLLNGGDRDYNDTIFRFSGVTTSTPHFGVAPAGAASSVPEPAALLLVLSGIGILGFAYRRR